MESIGGNLNEMQRTPLASAHVAALRAAGVEVVYPAGKKRGQVHYSEYDK